MSNAYDRNDLILFQEQWYTMAKTVFQIETNSERNSCVNSQVWVLMRSSAKIVIITIIYH